MSSLSAVQISKTSSLSPTQQSALHRTLQPQLAYRSSLIIPRTAPKRGILHNRLFHHRRVKVLPGASALPGRHVAIPGRYICWSRSAIYLRAGTGEDLRCVPSCRADKVLASSRWRTIRWKLLSWATTRPPFANQHCGDHPLPRLRRPM